MGLKGRIVIHQEHLKAHLRRCATDFNDVWVVARTASTKRLTKFIHPSPNGCTPKNGRGGLDTAMPDLRLNHIQRYFSDNRTGAKGVAQPVCLCAGAFHANVEGQGAGSNRLVQPTLDVFVQRLAANGLHRIEGAGQ